MNPVIIPFYQRPDQLERCIQHLQAQTLPVHIHIRNNNQENIYFTRAINEGILAYLDQDCEYMVILNQDM
jgi:GT2 family glycosyltransferase